MRIMQSTISSTCLSAACIAIAMVLAGCQPGNGTTPDDSALEGASVIPPPPMPVDMPADALRPGATSTLSATKGSIVAGELSFAPINQGVQVTGTLSGLDAGSSHGFHIHETGDCSAPDGTSAGGHFNPSGSEHGRVGSTTHHAGDTDNIVADADGMAMVDNRLEGATLGDGAPTDIVGKGVIVHAGVDDYTSQPTGDAGARLACGVIKLAK